MAKIHFAFICLACEIIRFFRIKFLVSPTEKTRNLSGKNRMLSQAIICRTCWTSRVGSVVRPSLWRRHYEAPQLLASLRKIRRWSGNQLTVLWKKLADLTRCPPQTSTDLLVSVMASTLFSFYWEFYLKRFLQQTHRLIVNTAKRSAVS